MKIKIISWNIWIDGFLDKWLDFLLTEDADVVGLQEVKDDDKNRDIIKALSEHGYNYVFAQTKQFYGDKVYIHGPAIFSRFPITESKEILLQDGSDERKAVYTQIDINNIQLNVFCTHLSHNHQQPSKKHEAQTKKLISMLPKSNVVVMGDFNATPNSRSIKLMDDVLTNVDYKLSPTWSVYSEGCVECNPQKIDTKLDYIFVSKDIETEMYKVGKSDGSDHLPIVAIINI